jgi:hypothetical protein
MRISELAAGAAFTPSGLACVVIRPHPPSRPRGRPRRDCPSSLSKEPVMSVSVLVRTTGEWSEVVGYAKLAVS